MMERARVKAVHRPVRLADGRIQIGTTLYGVGAEISGEHTDLAWRVLELMDGTRQVGEIVETAAQAFPGTAPGIVAGIVDDLIAAGFVEDAGAPLPPELTEAELERYSRGERFYAWVDMQLCTSRYAAQQRLKRSRVTVLGLGGTGSAVALSLVASGVGRVHCLDFDKVELSNLNRQLLYAEADVGHPKVDRAVARLRQVNSSVEVTGAELHVRSSADIVPVMADCDLFMLCADQPHGLIDDWTNETALRTRTPWVTGPYAGPQTTTTLYVPFITPCRLCMREHERSQHGGRWDGEPLARDRDAPWPNGVIAPTAAITGHLAALEAIYFLAGLRPQTLGRTFQRNLLVYDHNQFVEPPFWPDCPACGSGSP
jgi:molybdopterin/thiamine biosynthesis adenylyltransferase